MAPLILNDDGSASMASAVLMAHHAFRRDIIRFAVALTHLRPHDTARGAALREEWQYYRGALHAHHEIEDARIFPHLRAENPPLQATIDRLNADHRNIDPLLERGDAAFATLDDTAAAAQVAAAAEVVAALSTLLDAHLAIEEASVVPLLRDARVFPPPATDDEADFYAQGFAWSSHGIAEEVLDRVYQMLPPAVVSRMPGARRAFAERCVRVWGTAGAGATRTALPETPTG